MAFIQVVYDGRSPHPCPNAGHEGRAAQVGKPSPIGNCHHEGVGRDLPVAGESGLVAVNYARDGGVAPILF